MIYEVRDEIVLHPMCAVYHKASFFSVASKLKIKKALVDGTAGVLVCTAAYPMMFVEILVMIVEQIK